jgi:porin
MVETDRVGNERLRGELPMACVTLRGRRFLLGAGAALFLQSGGALAAEDAEHEHPAEPKLLLGDLGGVRPALEKAGIELSLSYIGETFGSVSGGIKRGVVYDGRLAMSIDVDFEKLAGWSGATAHVHAFQIHGRGPSANLVGNLMTLSSIEALPATRLNTLWFEQKLFEERVTIRVGQLAADIEFITSETAGGLINSTFGWPLLTGADTTGGGPAYPLSTPGIRLQLKPAEELTLRAGVFAGNPGGSGCTINPQICNPSGTTFSLSGGTLWLAELEYGANKEKNSAYLPGDYQIGAWREAGTFTDQFTATPIRHGNWGVYGIADQTVWRRTPGEEQGVNVFMRVGGAPSDRNLVTWYADGGFGFKGPLVERPDDVLTVGVAYGRISNQAALADRLAGPPNPVRDHEALVEASYTISVIPGWTVQPDLQYVIHPGGNVAKPAGAGTIQDALVLGLRTTLNF